MFSSWWKWPKPAKHDRSRREQKRGEEQHRICPSVERLEVREPLSIDIGVSGPGWIPYSAKPGDYLAAQTTLWNGGNTYVGTVPVQYLLVTSPYPGANGIQLQTDYRYGVGAYGASQSWSEGIRIPPWVNPGTYWIEEIADPSNWYYDTNRFNNSSVSWNQITISPPAADLAVYYVSAPSSATPGSTINVGLGLGNWSNTFSGSFQINIFASYSPNVASGTLLATDYRWNGLAGNSSQWFNENVYLPSPMMGTIYITASVTPMNYQDANWSNNTLSAFNVTTISVPQSFNPPLYKQWWQPWSSDIMGPGGGSLQFYGCAVTSLAMALAGKGITVNGQSADPRNLNAWLVANNGYSYGGDLNWYSLNQLSSRISLYGWYDSPLSVNPLQNYLAAGKVVIGKIQVYWNNARRDHWVLLTGYNGGTTFAVNDPSFSNTTLDSSRFLGFKVYTMN